ncbi:DUF5717 family protein [Aequitasia blattaphilus]|uniref:DUF5717 family protein n=1 Tax=Aequitasia blattaphilus TaxID=2949332 RepID=A0ABT1EG17_9FIRM|nr:DUF5717 family protein [Aequitasia blattaphilus]MCP1103402.1 DUF5717 family protein [Aequitasia blattaphilus]MCR8616042.1 DUF5717 family protein [Aequitasia blattaphilus]
MHLLKEKIQRFSKGDFQSTKPKITFDETNIVIIIGEGEVYRGSLTIKSNTKDRVRGIIYPSSLRVHLKEQGFDGTVCRIEYTYDGRGLEPGYVEDGFFDIVSDTGEYRLAFTAITEKPYITTPYGKVQSTEDFRKLAVKDYSEAARLFRSKEFYDILKYEDERILYLYDNMRKWSLGEQALEEFLVGIKQKECIFLTLQGEGMFFEDVKDATKGTLTIMKNTWGFMPIRIEAEGDFVRLNKQQITTDDFVGNAYEFEYVVRPEYLHGGRNFLRLKFITPYEILYYVVEVLQNVDIDENHRDEDLYMAQIVKSYIRHVSGVKTLNEWVEETLKRLKLLKQLDSQNDMYQLLTAHVSLMGNKEEEAKWILENYNYNRFALVKDFEVNSYYLYLTALIRGEGSHYARVIQDLEKTHIRHQESWILLWMLLDLDNRYKNPNKRLSMLSSHYDFGNHQVTYYLECFLCYKEKPALLKKLGDFELQVLNFAAKYQLITKELALYLANFASQQKFYEEKLFVILERTYEMYPESMILNAICILLIKGGKIAPGYFKWYKLAVDNDFRLAKLYEYYMLTVDEEQMKEPLPRVIYLYYLHGNNLNYKKCAFLYASLVQHEEEAGDLYLGYREQMVKFTWNQLMKRRVTDSLKILYKRFCREDEMDAKRIEAMRDICFSYLVTTKVPNMSRVLVIEKDGTIKQRVPYERDGAIIYLYDKESRIIWESREGRYYTDSIAFETSRLFYEPRFLELCKNYGDTTGAWKEEEVKRELDFDELYHLGIEVFPEKDVLRLVSREIRESEYKESQVLTYYSIILFKRDMYDKATLTYLAEHYTGGTRNMKELYYVLKDYNVPTHVLGEKIITQMIFSETILNGDEIFLDYYRSDGVYFRVKQAYLAYVTREYLLRKKVLRRSIFDIIMLECHEREELPDVCKIALLEYFSDKSYSQEEGEVLRNVMGELCEKGILFEFYMVYPKQWLRELLLFDKVLVSYKAKPGNRVWVCYKIRRNNKDELGFHKEALLPTFETMYVKDFILFDDEELIYYFQETDGNLVTESKKKKIDNKNNVATAGRYARLNEMIGVSPANLKGMMIAYEEEEIISEKIYHKY